MPKKHRNKWCRLMATTRSTRIHHHANVWRVQGEYMRLHNLIPYLLIYSTYSTWLAEGISPICITFVQHTTPSHPDQDQSTPASSVCAHIKDLSTTECRVGRANSSSSSRSLYMSTSSSYRHMDSTGFNRNTALCTRSTWHYHSTALVRKYCTCMHHLL